MSVLVNTIQAQNVGIGTTNPTSALHIVSTDDTALFATTTSNTPLTPAIHGYSNNVTNNQIGILGTYNGSGFGAGLVGIGYNGTVPPASKDIGVYASQHTGAGRALYVDGKMQLIDGTQAKGLILTSDETGTATWQKPAAAQHAFGARYYGGGTNLLDVPKSTTLNIAFDAEDYDMGNDFVNGIFTAPDSGLYHFDANIVWSLSSSTTSYYIESYLSITDASNPFGSIRGMTSQSFDALGQTGDFTQNISTDVYLNAGNTIRVLVYQSSSVTQRILGHVGFFATPYSRFSGHKLF